MTSVLLRKIVLLKQKVDDVKKAPILQRANRAEAVITEAIYIIEELATNQVELEKFVNYVRDDIAGVVHG